MDMLIHTYVGRYLVVDDIDDQKIRWWKDSSTCPPTMRPSLSYKNLGHVERRAAILILSLSPQIEGSELKYVRKVIGWKREEMAAHFNVTKDTVCKWEDNNVTIDDRVPTDLLRYLEVEEGREGSWPGRPQISYSCP